MGRITEILDYLNKDKITDDDKKSRYHYIDCDNEHLKRLRSKHVRTNTNTKRNQSPKESKE